MHKTTIREVLDDESLFYDDYYEIYLVRDGDEVMYVGKSNDVYKRIQQHAGLVWPYDLSFLGRAIRDAAPLSDNWTVEVYTVAELEQVVRDWYREGGLDFRGRVFDGLADC